ncbi:MAG: tryptophan synthase subunit alpha [Rhodospirillales bacterium]
MSGRLEKRFRELSGQGRGGLVTFVTAGDPNGEVSLEILKGLPGAGADIIELGMPFSDPMADGPAIQMSSLRALKQGASLASTIGMVRDFRATDCDTPLILMGYYNPIYVYGTEAFLKDAREAGVDGLIIVDLPPEEEEELAIPAADAGIDFIFLTAPTTDDERLPTVLRRARGFVYYVSITGITGTASASSDHIRGAVERLRRHTGLPIAVGFGIKTPEQAAEISSIADAAVVGSALVNKVAENLDDDGAPLAGLSGKVLGFVSELADGVRAAGNRRAAP